MYHELAIVQCGMARLQQSKSSDITVWRRDMPSEVER
jgi:hypothetical protein